MSERKIGEIFFDGNVSLQVEKVVYGCSCSGCYYIVFNDCIRNYDTAGSCVNAYRTDHNFVIFKKIQP